MRSVDDRDEALQRIVLNAEAPSNPLNVERSAGPSRHFRRIK